MDEYGSEKMFVKKIQCKTFGMNHGLFYMTSQMLFWINVYKFP